MESLRFDVAPYGISTTIVEPGFFRTELLVEGASPPRVLAPDVELLYVHRQIPTGGYWPAEATAEVVPLVMRFAEEGWRVLNFGYERIPIPEWPPTLW
jgi:NAD(P)-dependent dehydrogenase (short-subunit alcohol dehydrogenase family)